MSAATAAKSTSSTLDAVLQESDALLPQQGPARADTPLPTGLAAGHKLAPTPLRFPGKVLADEKSGRLFIADSNHNRIVVARLDGTLVDTIGSGQLGSQDGDFATATFNHPQGMALAGDMLYVADTENHLLRKVDLKHKSVEQVAGTGKQGHGWYDPRQDRRPWR